MISFRRLKSIIVFLGNFWRWNWRITRRGICEVQLKMVRIMISIISNFQCKTPLVHGNGITTNLFSYNSKYKSRKWFDIPINFRTKASACKNHRCSQEFSLSRHHSYIVLDIHIEMVASVHSHKNQIYCIQLFLFAQHRRLVVASGFSF